MTLLLDGKPLQSSETNTAGNVANGVLLAAGELATLLNGKPGKLVVSGIAGYPSVKVTLDMDGGPQPGLPNGKE